MAAHPQPTLVAGAAGGRRSALVATGCDTGIDGIDGDGAGTARRSR